MDRYMRLLHWSLDTRKALALRGDTMKSRIWARRADHRIWVMGMGAAALGLTVLSFATLQFTGQPALNQDTVP